MRSSLFSTECGDAAGADLDGIVARLIPSSTLVLQVLLPLTSSTATRPNVTFGKVMTSSLFSNFNQSRSIHIPLSPLFLPWLEQNIPSLRIGIGSE